MKARFVIAATCLLCLPAMACGTDSAEEGTGGAGGTAGAGGSGGSGGVVPSDPRPVLDDAAAADHTILNYLDKAGALPAPVSDGWDPTAGLGDAAEFTATFQVAADGGTHTTVQAAIDAAVAEGGTSRAYIEVAAGTYREVICVPSGARPITLYGTGEPEDVEIVFDNYSGKPKADGEPANPCNPSLTSTTFGTSGSATFAAFANEFQAKNLTISNDIDESTITESAQAVALLTQGDKLVFENVRLLGNQDTLYMKSSSNAFVARVYLKDSYVAGDVDFIFGRATAVLDGCTIEFVSGRRGPSGGGYLFAPSTDARNPYGFLIINSELIADAETAPETVHLGRAWDEGQNDVATYAMNVMTGVYPNGAVVIRDSTLGEHIRVAAPWFSSTISRPFSSVAGTYPANRFYEYANTGPGAKP